MGKGTVLRIAGTQGWTIREGHDFQSCRKCKQTNHSARLNAVPFPVGTRSVKLFRSLSIRTDCHPQNRSATIVSALVISTECDSRRLIHWSPTSLERHSGKLQCQGTPL